MVLNANMMSRSIQMIALSAAISTLSISALALDGDYEVQRGSETLNSEQAGPSSGYAPPMEGLVNFANNSKWVHTDGEKKEIKKEKDESTGVFMFRQFKNHVQRSAERFPDEVP